MKLVMTLISLDYNDNYGYDDDSRPSLAENKDVGYYEIIKLCLVCKGNCEYEKCKKDGKLW